MTAKIVVPGIAEPKGSVSAFVNKRTGTAVIVHGGRRNRRKDGSLSDAPDRYRAWVRHVKAAATAWQAIYQRKIENSEPLEVTLCFYLPRPKSLPKREVYPIRRNDIDKLARCVLDCLNEIVIADDGRIVDLIVRKRFASTGSLPRCEITIDSALRPATA